MRCWINIFAITIGSGSIAIVWLSTSILEGLPKVLLTHFLENGQPFSSSVVTNLNVLQHFKEYHHFASSVWCVRRLDGSKKCNFKNIFYMPQFKEHLVFLLNEHSVISGVESTEALKDINLSSLKNHTKCILKLIVLKSTEYILNKDFLVVSGNSLIMKRFKPDNIMHVIHDDLLPLFFTLEELCQGNLQQCLSSHHLIFLDDNEDAPYFEWYRLFSNRIPMSLKSQNINILFKNSIIGLAQESIWFDYGFKNNQGPVHNSHFNILLFKKFTEFVKEKFSIVQEDYNPESHNPAEAVFLNRMLNRKILNSDMVEKYIIEAYAKVHEKKVNILKMDLSVNGSKSLISKLQYTNLLVGMHGSAMVFSIFLPEGSKIIEVFPYGIQPNIVSPIKALCSLLNTHYSYTFWVNKNESNSITHPEYPPLLGGIKHLSSLEQEDIIKTKIVPAVKCCHNPLYLFRMFQDTVVDESFYPLLIQVFNENSNVLSSQENSKILEKRSLNKWYFPPPVFNLTCECVRGELKLVWSYPLNISSDIRFSIYISNGFSTTTHFTNLSMSMIECEIEQLNRVEFKKQPPLSVWVKTLEDLKESVDSYMLCSYHY